MLQRQEVSLLLSGLAEAAVLRNIGKNALSLPGGYCCLGKAFCFPGFQGEGSNWTDSQAEAGTVTQLFLCHPGLAVFQDQRPLGTRTYAGSAAIAQFFIYPDNGPQRHIINSFQ